MRLESLYIPELPERLEEKMALINYSMEVLFQFKCDGASLSKIKENKMIILDLNT
jgi:hypothetical protein